METNKVKKVNIDVKLMKEVKLYCTRIDIFIKDFVADAMKEKMKRDKKK